MVTVRLLGLEPSQSVYMIISNHLSLELRRIKKTVESQWLVLIANPSVVLSAFSYTKSQ